MLSANCELSFENGLPASVTWMKWRFRTEIFCEPHINERLKSEISRNWPSMVQSVGRL